MKTIDILKMIAAASIVAVSAPAMAESTPTQSHIIGCDIDMATGKATRTIDASTASSTKADAMNYTPAETQIISKPSQDSMTATHSDTRSQPAPHTATLAKKNSLPQNCPEGTIASPNGMCKLTEAYGK